MKHDGHSTRQDPQQSTPERILRRRREAGDARDAVAALWSELQQHLGAERLAELDASGPDGPATLYIQHLVRTARETGLDVTGHLPWNARPSWSDWVAPLYQEAWELSCPDGGRAGGGHAGSETGSETGAGVAVQRRAAGFGPAVDEATEDWFRRTLAGVGEGRELDEREQALLEQVHGRRFPEARIHEGGAAEALAGAVRARAFTVGRDIFLPGGASVDSAEGAELLAHEATHVAQAAEGRLPEGEGGLSVSSPSAAHEQEAERKGQEARAVSTAALWDPDQLLGLDTVQLSVVLQLREALGAPAGEHPEVSPEDALDQGVHRAGEAAREAPAARTSSSGSGRASSGDSWADEAAIRDHIDSVRRMGLGLWDAAEVLRRMEDSEVIAAAARHLTIASRELVLAADTYTTFLDQKTDTDSIEGALGKAEKLLNTLHLLSALGDAPATSAFLEDPEDPERAVAWAAEALDALKRAVAWAPPGIPAISEAILVHLSAPLEATRAFGELMEARAGDSQGDR